MVEGTRQVSCEGTRVDGDAWQCVYDLTGRLVDAREVPRLQAPSGASDAITGTWLVREPNGVPREHRQVVVPTTRRATAPAFAADDGGALLAMPFYDETTFGAGTPAARVLAPEVRNSARSDLALGRYAADGTLQWVRHFAAWDAFDVDAVTRMPDGDWLVAVRAISTRDDIRIERAPDDWVEVGGRPFTIMLCRFSDDGLLRWVTPMTAKAAQTYGAWVHDLSPHADGGFSVSGAFIAGLSIGGPWDDSPFQFDRPDASWVFLADFDADGQPVWAAEVGHVDNRNSEESLRLAPDPAGRLLVTGRIAGPTHGLDFEPQEEDDFLAWVGHVARGGPLSLPPREPTATLGEVCELDGAPGCAHGVCAEQCVECAYDLHCPDTHRCASHACVEGARGSGDAGDAGFAEPCDPQASTPECAQGLICDPTHGLCAECVTDDDCPNTCFGGTCR